MRSVTLVTCLISALAAPVAAQLPVVQQPVRDIPRLVASARGTVVLLKSFDAQGKMLGLGSGFRIAGGRFVTNAHVVASAARVEIFDENGALLGIARFAEMLSTTVDLAILPSVGARGPALPLANMAPSVGEQVIVIGAPEGLTNTVSDGIVSAIRKIDARQLLQITAPISPGSSGGPVLNTRGEVVGVSVSILREGQNLNFAVPIADLAALVASRPGQFQFPSSLDDIDRGSGDRERSGRTNPKPLPPLLSVGSEVSGTIDSDDRLSNGLYVNYFRLSGAEGSTLSISVASDDFDPAIGVYRIVNGSVILITADPNITRGRIARTSVMLGGNNYFAGVFAADTSRAKLGRYSIRVEATQANAPAPANPAAEDQSRWLRAGTGSDDSRIEFDRTSVTPTGSSTYLAWQRKTYASPHKDSAGDVADVMMLQYEVSCGDHRFRLKAGTKYLEGRLVRSSILGGPWESVVPQSVGEVTANAICNYARAYLR